MMKGKRNYLLGLFIIVSHLLLAQSDELETILDRGKVEFERGNYEEALTWFKQAYKLDRGSNKVCYELALTHLSLGNDEDVAVYSGKIIKRGGEFQEDAFLLNGSAWENLGRAERALKIYKEGLEHFPSSYLLHYNLALALFNEKEYDEAQEYAINAIELYPAHSSSHLLLAYIMYDKGERIQTMLPLYYFLLIEQNSNRSVGAYDLLHALWDQGVRKKGQREIQLLNAGYEHSEFGEAELAVSLIKSAELANDSNKVNSLYNTRLIRFAENNSAFFKILSESSEGKYSFWWEFYVGFFEKIERSHFTESFSYFISSCKYNDDVLLWLSDNHQDFQKFTKWMEAQ
ncbi:tetratricopeptide repeat protein [Labilibacter sediminis]|nr:tetratricopeptide repeat protein [Labilibacter sediminis]